MYMFAFIRLKIAAAREKQAMAKSQQTASSAVADPDQQQTVPVDLSPLARTFYGVPTESQRAKPQEFHDGLKKTDSADSLNAPTRRLDSFRVPTPAKEVEQPEPPVENEPMGDGDEHQLEPKNLNSVFDQQALVVQS